MSEQRSIAHIIEQFQKVVDFLEPLPRTRPKEKTQSETYAAGLYDMATWMLEQIEHEETWSGLAAYFSHVPNFPQHGFELTVKPKRKRKQ